MAALVRCWLREEPAEDLGELVGQYAAALWIEERQTATLAAAVARAFGGK